MNATTSQQRRILIVKSFTAILVFAGLIAWIILTPSGFFAKLAAVGYSLCHQIASRSFFFYGTQMPLCSRCTGMYIGVMVGFGFLIPGKRRGGMPSKKILWLLGASLLLFAIDGINSYLGFVSSAPHLYAPQNWLRLVTGTTLGLAIPLVLMPIFNQTVWANSLPEPIVSSFRKFFLMLAIGLGLDLLVLANIGWIRFVFAILTIFTVAFLLTVVYTVLWIIITKREYRSISLKQLWFWLVAGFGTTLLQVSALDAIRLVLTGTWAGFSL